jgi:serine/threonine protein kinase
MMSLFCALLERSSDQERADYLDAACGQDAELRARIEALLRAHEQAGGFLREDSPAGDSGATIDDPIKESPGTVIGPYKLLEQIGEGGFGVVFMAEQTEPVRRKVALKVLKPGMDTRQVVARFEAERQALALMDHPNIARVLDGGQTSTGRPYFVMDLVKGLPITEYCDQAQMAPRERLELFVHLCQAVQHAHQKGIIHRDLKPSNVLVTLHDGTPLVKVIDFGIAKALGQSLTDKTLFTGFAQMVGTPLYMSPEQAALSNIDVDTRSDVYSLGVLLYELLTGTTPFDKERLKEVGYDEMRRIIREEEPPRPSTRISTLGQAAATVSTQRKSNPKRLSQLCRGELDWIVMKALEKDRNRRYETASAFAADVERYLNDEAVQACPPSAWYRFRKFARRNKAAFLTGSAVVVAVILGVIGLAVNNRMVTREKEQKEAALADALHEKERAEVSLAKAKQAVEQYLVATAGNPKLKTADLQALRQQLLATAIPFLEEFVRQEGDDRGLIVERAWALYHLAAVRAEMGQTEAALSDYEQARASWTRLASDLPSVATPRQHLAHIDNESGALLTSLGQIEKAEAAYRRAMSAYEQLIADFPAVPAHQSRLAATLNNLANLEGERGNQKEKQRLLEQALARQEAAIRANPKDQGFRQSLGNHQCNLGTVLGSMYKWNEAARAYESAQTTFRALVAEFGAHPEHRNGLAAACTALADVQCEQGKLGEAEKAYREAIKTREQLAADFTSVPRYRQELAGSYHNFGLLLRDRGKYDEAEPVFRRALSVERELANGFPNVPEHWSALASSERALGMLFARQRKWAEAEAAQREALAAWEKLVKLCPAVPKYAVNLGGTQVNLGLIEADKGDFKTALSWLDKAIATLGAVPSAAKESGDCRRFRGNAHGARAGALMRLERYPEALRDWEQVLQLDVQGDRRRVRMQRMQRALTLAHLKEHARATGEADAIARIQGLPAYLLHDAASVHAIAAATVRDQADLSEKYSARAVALLRRAFEKNYQAVADEVREDRHLDFLRSREDFRKLLKDFQARNPGSGDKSPRGEKKRSPQ